jgi:hypothetical protein
MLIAALALAAAGTALADSVAPRSYALPGHGQLQLGVPAEWLDQLDQPPKQVPPTIYFKPRNGAAFEILVTPLWAMPDISPASSPQELDASVRAAAKSALAQSVEKTIKVKPLKGAAAAGYYFSATDKAPKAGDFKFLTQGLLRVGELTVTFTVLTNEGQDAVVKSALEMLAGASQSAAQAR